MQRQTFLIREVTVPSLSGVERGAGELLSVVEVRSIKVYDRSHRSTFHVLLHVPYTGGPG